MHDAPQRPAVGLCNCVSRPARRVRLVYKYPAAEIWQVPQCQWVIHMQGDNDQWPACRHTGLRVTSWRGRWPGTPRRWDRKSNGEAAFIVDMAQGFYWRSTTLKQSSWTKYVDKYTRVLLNTKCGLYLSPLFTELLWNQEYMMTVRTEGEPVSVHVHCWPRNIRQMGTATSFMQQPGCRGNIQLFDISIPLEP